MKKKCHLFALIGIIAVAGLSGCKSEERTEAPEKIETRVVKVGELAPTFKLQSLDGTAVRLDELRGKPVLLNFFGTYCEPCKIEMPDLNRFYQKHKTRVEVIAISAGESKADVEKFRVSNLAGFRRQGRN